jgi:hypothetical protein
MARHLPEHRFELLAALLHVGVGLELIEREIRLVHAIAVAVVAVLLEERHHVALISEGRSGKEVARQAHPA